MTATTAATTMRLADIEVVQGANARQDVNGVDGLADSIRIVGILVPLTVDTDGRLLAGHRRHAAALAAGLDEVPVTVVQTTADVTEQAVAGVENIARRQLTAAEEADAVGRMLEHGYTPEGAAQVLDMPLARVRRRQQLLALPDALRALWGPGGGAPPSAVPAAAAILAVAPGLAETMVAADRISREPRKPNELGWRPPAIADLADPVRYLLDLQRTSGHKGMPDQGDLVVARLGHRLDEEHVPSGLRADYAAKVRALNDVYAWERVEITDADLDAAQAAGVAIAFDNEGETVRLILSGTWLGEHVEQVMMPRFHKKADATIKRAARGQRAASARDAKRKEKADGELTETERKAVEADRARRDAERRWKGVARGANLDLGRALLDGLATVEVTADVARLFAENSLGPRPGAYDYNQYSPSFNASRLAAAGLRYVMPDWQIETRTPTKADPEKITVTYPTVEEATKRLWKWFDAAKEPGDILGRAIVIHAAARWAVEHVLPQSQRMMPGHDRGDYGGPHRTVLAPQSAKLLERLAKASLPASTRRLIREMERAGR